MLLLVDKLMPSLFDKENDIELHQFIVNVPKQNISNYLFVALIKHYN